MTSQIVCIHHKFGFYKNGDYCRKRHFQTKCERKECDATHCEKRHPRECRYFRDYKRCTFGDYCLYDHSVYLDPFPEELKLVKARLEAVEKSIEEKHKRIKFALESLKQSQRASPNRNEALPVVNYSTNSTCPTLAPNMSTLVMLNSTDHNYQGSSNLDFIHQLDRSTNLPTNHPPNQHQDQHQGQPKPAHEKECDSCPKVFESKAGIGGTQ